MRGGPQAPHPRPLSPPRFTPAQERGAPTLAPSFGGGQSEDARLPSRRDVIAERGISIPRRGGLAGCLTLLTLFLLACNSGPTGSGQALVGVTVIDGLGNPPRKNQVVWIEDGRIAAVESADTWQAPHGVQLVQLPGRFVLPGLIDMHAHVTIMPLADDGTASGDATSSVKGTSSAIDHKASKQVLATLLAFGITTVRNPAAPAADGVALRQQVSAGDLLGPRILTAGDALARTAPTFGPFVATPDDVTIRQEIQRQAKLGVDYIKVYSSLSPELIASAIDEAHRAGKPVIGHLQRTTWTEAAELGIDAITHGAPWSAAYLPQDDRDGYRGNLRDRLTWLERVDFDGPEIQAMIAALAEHHVVVDPTLIAYQTKFFADDPRHTENPELHLAPELSRDLWQRHSFVGDWTADDFARAHAAWPRVLELTKRLYDGGVLLTAGSDLPNPWVIPGVSLHQELQLLAKAGIPPIEVLKIATHNAAVALGLEADLGSVEVGKIADLVVLAADPTVLLKNTRAISHIFQAGRYIDPSAVLSSLE